MAADTRTIAFGTEALSVPDKRGSVSFEVHSGLPQPQWTAVREAIENEQAAAWIQAARHWLNELASAISPDAFVFATDKLLVLAEQDGESLLAFAAKVLSHLDHLLEGIGSAYRPWPHVVVVFADRERFYDYIDYFHREEGEYGGAAGMFLRREFPHVAVAPGQQWALQATIAHELTHDYLYELGLPLWLEEGLTQTIEERLAGQVHAQLNREMKREHVQYWSKHTLNSFWSGSGFHAADEEQRLCYQLALILLRSILLQKRKQAAQFVREAHWSDAGEWAAQRTLGCSLADFVLAFLGEGDWAPSRYDSEPEPDAPH